MTELSPFRVAFLRRLADRGLCPADVGRIYRQSVKQAIGMPAVSDALPWYLALLGLGAGASHLTGKMLAQAMTDDPTQFAAKAKNQELIAAYQEAARRLQQPVEHDEQRPAAKSVSSRVLGPVGIARA